MTIEQISGVARRHQVSDKWIKRAGDERPCLIPGCDKEGHFIPMLTVHGKSDAEKTGRFYIAILPVVLCTSHATTDPKEYVPDPATLQEIRAALGDEPDLERMVVQFMGNHRCRVERSQELGAEKQGLYEHYYDSNPANGKAGIRTRKVK